MNHTFLYTCGCNGVLPEQRGQVNKFVATEQSVLSRPSYWTCRVAQIIHGSQYAAKKYGYKPIDPNTPHSLIRKLMEEPNCERCGQPLKWEFGAGLTPHLHHDHDTGEIYGFTHIHCNPRALEDEIERLKNEIVRKRRVA